MRAAAGHEFRYSDREIYKQHTYTHEREEQKVGMDGADTIPARLETEHWRGFEKIYTPFVARAFAVMGSDEIFIDINAVGPDINQAGLGRALVYSPNQHDHYRELFDKRFMGFLKDTCGM